VGTKKIALSPARQFKKKHRGSAPSQRRMEGEKKKSTGARSLKKDRQVLEITGAVKDDKERASSFQCGQKTPRNKVAEFKGGKNRQENACNKEQTVLHALERIRKNKVQQGRIPEVFGSGIQEDISTGIGGTT